ncbi:MAG: hypothetical protein M9888_03150 [Chitinophagales bacterium]|nr:hypothetical protein [Chitinophagales bacterium]
MYKFFSRKNTWLTLIAFFMTIFISNAQSVLVNAQIIPPFSPYISTYVDNPNKLLLTLTNTSREEVSIRLSVRIFGDNGVSGTTSSDFRPASPIVIPPLQTKVIDFSSNETKSYFDLNNIILVGITKEQLMRNQALPEGIYTICINAFDYNTSELLSIDGKGCTVPFQVSYIDPCLPIQPLCDAEIDQKNPQNILFSWTPPATAKGNIQYEFTLKEVPNNLNPNDVVKNAAFPVIYSGTFSGTTSILYTNALPQLVGGHKYVWRIKCIDPSNQLQFKNNGYSQACTFSYKAMQNVVPVTPKVETTPQVQSLNSTFTVVETPHQGTIYIPPLIKPFIVNGQLMYNWNSGQNKNYPMRNATIRLVVKYFLDEGSNSVKTWNSISFDGVSDGDEIAIAKTDANGNFIFNFITPYSFGKMADNYTIGSGEFKWTGTLYRKAVVVITSSHAQYYFNPLQSITPISGETVSFNSLVVPVKTCKLEVTVERNGSTSNQLYGTSNRTLPDANVYLCRKPLSIFALNTFPEDDGLPDLTGQKLFISNPEALNGLEIVARGKTNSKGKILFERVAIIKNPYYQYFIYADFDKKATGFYNYTSEIGPEKFKQLVAQGGFYLSEGTGETYVQTIQMKSELPTIAGVVIDKFDGKPQSGLVTLSSFYIGQNNNRMICHSPTWADELIYAYSLSSCSSYCSKLVKRYFYMNSDGRFSFDNLSILYDKNDLKPTGPLHVVTTKVDGYQEGKHGVPEMLFYGSQHYAEIKIERGAMISGRVIDGESGEGLVANFFFLDENKSGNCDYNGYFSDYPARKMSTNQKLIISCPKYITDTVEVVIDKASVDLGTLKLYTIKRRLTVSVKDAQTEKSIENATVEILGVSKTCYSKVGQYQVAIECPLSEKTKKFINIMGLDIASTSFSFKNAGGQENNGQVYQVRISGPENSNYEARTISMTIPYSSISKSLEVKLEPATCLSGYVYAGKGNSSPVEGAKVKMDITTANSLWMGSGTSKTGEIETKTDANGYYELKNIPLRSYPQTIRAIKGGENLVGDSFVIVTQPTQYSSYYNFNGSNYESPNNLSNMNFNYYGLPGQNTTPKCIDHSFNLTIYNGIDLSSLMGFPIEVTSLSPSGDEGAIIDGYFASLNGNNQFSVNSNTTLQFKGVKILPSTSIKNVKGIPAATPELTPIVTENNMLPLLLYNSVNGMVEEKKLGIYLDKDVGGKQYGVLKGRVKILNTAFNQNVIAFSDTFFLALPNETSISKLTIPVLNADKTIMEPANAPNGFKISNSTGNPVRFSLPGFPNSVLSDYNASIFYNGELNLTALIQTNIADISPSNLNLKISNIKLSKGVNPSINSTTPISFSMGNWKLSSNDFKLDENGLKLNKGTIETGVSIPFSNLDIRYDQLIANNMDIQLSNMKLAGIHPVDIVSTNKTFGLVDESGGKKAWKIYLGPTPDIAATISNLPGLNAADKIELSSISLMSTGEQLLALRGKSVTLRNILKFIPLDGTYMSVSDNQFLLSGLFQLNLPDPKSFSTTLAFERNGSSLNFNMVNTQIVSFYKPTLLEHKFYKDPTLTDGKFTYNGESEEPNAFPTTKTTLYYTKDSVSIWIDKGQDIPIKDQRKFGKAEGGMRIENGKWTPFWFSGDMEGMAGISDQSPGGKKQRMKFFVDGSVTADAQSLSVKNVETPFGNMSWVYEFPNSRLIGHLDIEMDLSSTFLKAGINTIVDGGGWFFSADGMLKVAGVGDLNFFGLFGNYPTFPTGVKMDMGDFKCLPSAFNSKVEGFLFQAGIHKQVVPEISFSIPALIDIGFGVDIGLTTRLWKSFSSNDKTLGLSLLARGHAYAKGACEATCSEVGADLNAEVSISGSYNGVNGEYDINGCASVGFNLKVDQCLGALGVCSDACVGIDTGQLDLGINMGYNSNNGADIGIQFQSCSSVCK